MIWGPDHDVGRHAVAAPLSVGAHDVPEELEEGVPSSTVKAVEQLLQPEQHLGRCPVVVDVGVLEACRDGVPHLGVVRRTSEGPVDALGEGGGAHEQVGALELGLLVGHRDGHAYHMYYF